MTTTAPDQDIFATIAERNLSSLYTAAFHELLSKDISARELLTALQSDKLAPYLDEIRMPVNGHAKSARALHVVPAAGAPKKKGGRPPKAAKAASEEHREYVTYSEEEKTKMREIILAAVEKEPKISTPELIAVLQKSFKGLADHTGKNLLKDMVKEKHLKMIKGRPNRFQVGKVPL